MNLITERFRLVDILIHAYTSKDDFLEYSEKSPIDEY